MHKLLMCMGIAASILGRALPSNAGQIQETWFVFDVSTSAAVGIDTVAASSAGNYVEKSIRAMKPHDVVKVRTLGSAGVVSQQIHIDATLGKKANIRPRRAARDLAKVIRNLPKFVKDGTIALQETTNVIGFVETLAPSLDCENKLTTVVIFSDGIEWSEQVNGDDLLAGKVELPTASGPILRGCVVELRGLGEQNSELGTNNAWFLLLREQWTKFFQSADAASFKAYAEFE